MTEKLKPVMRRGMVFEWLKSEGFSSYEVRQMLESGLIKPAPKRRPNARDYFHRDQIQRDVLGRVDS